MLPCCVVVFILFLVAGPSLLPWKLFVSEVLTGAQPFLLIGNLEVIFQSQNFLECVDLVQKQELIHLAPVSSLCPPSYVDVDIIHPMTCQDHFCK